MLLYLYTPLYYLALPFIVARLLLRSRKAPGYRYRIAERSAIFNAPPLHNPIWIHAVSLGESIAAIPLINGLLKQYPNRSIVVTTTTATGSERIKTALKDKVLHVYNPYDTPYLIKRFLKKIQPRLVIIM